ncbi:hypothetical protein CBM2597_U10121 [Cupriavidus taiwanensis]|uniref:Uncharacterized protein n=1 Tax=Cupriavidus taiwanensis TaxID=164546 RepID=A0A7Z7JFH7_9BURK|nr:hypothetical protein CBM2597_U10121 [Cupriavidus taiwanensis]SPC25627.1 hypothetical protein CBM2594_U10128 [Cupriavidus taiwanensis]
MILYSAASDMLGVVEELSVTEHCAQSTNWTHLHCRPTAYSPRATACSLRSPCKFTARALHNARNVTVTALQHR